MTAALIILALVALSTLLGFAWRAAQGRVKRTDGMTVVRASEIPGLRRLAGGATLLQFSTEVCAPCVPTRALLGQVAAAHSDVAHVDVDVTLRPELAQRFNILQTPTTLILDRRGVVRARIGGAPRRDTLSTELARIREAA
jgi:thiol-disulfide isomerase/thioredoxin